MSKACSQLLAEAARRASSCLTDDGRTRILGFIRAQQQEDGGFRGRSKTSDLYYTHFAVRALVALGEPLPAATLAAYLERFRQGTELEFVDLACLAGCAAAVAPGRRDDGILERIERYRTPDGGYAEKRGGRSATAYGCFLALLAYESQEAPLPNPAGLAGALHAMAPTVTTAVAAKAMLLACLGAAPDPADGDLLASRAARRGGFRAAPLAPIADLLSTATSLCALSAMGRSLDTLREPCTDFVDSLWQDNGGFSGHWADRIADCEYTYYGLLSLGVLAS